MEFKSFYKTVGGNKGLKCKYPTRLDTYGKGCGFNCKYCYARSLLDFRKMWNPHNPSVADIGKIKRKLDKVEKGSIIRMGGMTDCFQPCEIENEVTYKTIQAMNERGIGYLIVTKSSLIGTDKYLDVMDKDLAHVQITITSTDDETAKKYEGATLISQRIKTVEKLYDRGFDTFVRLSPYIEQYVDLDKLADIRCDKLVVEFLRINHWIKKWFDIDFSQYTEKENGYLHLPLDVKLEQISKIHGYKEITVCDSVHDHYDYWREHFNPNPQDCCNLKIF